MKEIDDNASSNNLKQNNINQDQNTTKHSQKNMETLSKALKANIMRRKQAKSK